MLLSEDVGSRSFDDTYNGVLQSDSVGDCGDFAFGVEQLVT